jgi:two-component system sensor histidine kinase YesM
MRFRTKLIISYSLVVTVLVTVIAFVFQYYNLHHLEENTQQNLDILSENMSHQLDEIVRPMKFITDFLLSDSKTLSAINSLCRSERRPSSVSFIAQAKNDLRQSIST